MAVATAVETAETSAIKTAVAVVATVAVVTAVIPASAVGVVALGTAVIAVAAVAAVAVVGILAAVAVVSAVAALTFVTVVAAADVTSHAEARQGGPGKPSRNRLRDGIGKKCWNGPRQVTAHKWFWVQEVRFPLPRMSAQAQIIKNGPKRV